MYPNATSADLYGYARCALSEARGWLELLTSDPWPPRTAGRLLEATALLVEADELRGLARRRRS